MAFRRICRIEIENFRGITESKLDVPRNGLKLSGDEGAGKTSHLDAISAALRGTDLGVEVIRRGAEKTTLLVAFDDGTKVRRSVTAKGVGQPTVQLDGFKATSPQTWLNERLGLASFDVISFIGAKPADRVRMLQQAIPCTVTVERLRQWVPALETFDCSGHGLEVVKRLEKIARDKRQAANATAKSAQADADRAAQDAATAGRGVDPNALPVETAKSRVAEADRALSKARADVDGAKAHELKTAGQREKVAKLRADASAIFVADETWVDAGSAVDSARRGVEERLARVKQLEEELAKAQHRLGEGEAQLSSAVRRFQDIEETRAKAGKLREQATELESALSAAAPERPSDEELATLEKSAENIRTWLAAAEHAARARVASDAANAATEKAKTAHAEAGRLDAIVKALATDAPRALMAESGGIEGLEIDGETIRVDGVAIDSLSSGEQLRLAVSLAKKMNKAPILIVDHLEHLAPSKRDAFLREACSDGYQVFATCVDDGALAIEGLEFEEEAAAAQ